MISEVSEGGDFMIDKYKFINPRMIWMPGVRRLLESYNGKKDARRNQVCQFENGYTTPEIACKIKSCNSHLNKIYLRLVKEIKPLVMEAYALSTETQLITGKTAIEDNTPLTSEISQRKAAHEAVEKEINEKRLKEITIRIAEIKAELDIVDELIQHYEERVDGILKKAISKYWKEQMTALGLGCEDPWHLQDLDQKGHHIEEIAKKNRKVLIVDVNSLDAVKIK